MGLKYSGSTIAGMNGVSCFGGFWFGLVFRTVSFGAGCIVWLFDCYACLRGLRMFGSRWIWFDLSSYCGLLLAVVVSFIMEDGVNIFLLHGKCCCAYGGGVVQVLCFLHLWGFIYSHVSASVWIELQS